MDLQEAKEECERWLAHLDAQKERVHSLQRVAAMRRRGEMGLSEAREKIEEFDIRAPTVYDGSRLADAIRVMLRQI